MCGRMLAKLRTSPSGSCSYRSPRGSRPLLAVMPFVASTSEARFPRYCGWYEEVSLALPVCAW
jgi:hypothetical protein